MYQIPKETDLTIIKGANVQSVAYSINTISINFDTKGFIRIEGSFSFSIFNKIYNCDTLYPAKEYGLLNLLEKQVTSIEVSDAYEDLTITFSDASKLVLFGNKQFESYSIKFGEIDLLV